MLETVNYQSLTDEQLLSIVIREKQHGEVAKSLIAQFNSLPDILINADEAELSNVKGIGTSRATHIKAISELYKRISRSSTNEAKVSCSRHAADLMMNDMRYLNKEYMKAILLNIKCNVISVETISIGTLNSSLVHPRETFNPAIRKSAASIILVHNHPSGDPEPSAEDINITKRLIEAGKILGIEVVDHIIIGDGKYVSLKDRSLV
jgi:DNA repair protein RadC